jgi:hypothetical protein
LNKQFPAPDPTSTTKYIKPKGIFIGVNEVTKYKISYLNPNFLIRNLERNNVRLVLLFKDAPVGLVNHIPYMCHLKSVPLIPLTKDNFFLPVSTVAMGFKVTNLAEKFLH